MKRSDKVLMVIEIIGVVVLVLLLFSCSKTNTTDRAQAETETQTISDLWIEGFGNAY